MGTNEPQSPLQVNQPPRAIWRGAALVAMTVLVYLPSIRCGYIWDDDLWVTNNVLLRSADGLKRIWTDLDAVPEYYPLTLSSFWIDYQLWGLRPAGYHVENILLHAIVVVLLWRLLLRLKVPGAWLAAAVVGVHPVNVESVSWVTERKNVLCGALYLGAIISFLRFDEDRRWGWYALTIALYIAAVMAKTVTVTLPVVLLILIWWRKGKLTFKDAMLVAPFFLVALPLGILAMWMQKHHTGATGEMFDLTFGQRVIVAGRAFWFYLSKIVWPVKLTFIYPRWPIQARDAVRYLWPVTAVVAFLVLVLNRGSTELAEVQRPLARAMLVALLIFAVTLFPALGFFNILWQIYSFVADHVQYIAAMPIIALLAAAIEKRFRSKIIYFVVLVPLAIITWRQQSIYMNLETLWRDTLAKNPSAWMAHNNLGMVLFHQGNLDDAEKFFRQSLALNPKNDKARINLGNVLYQQGKQQLSQSRIPEAAGKFIEALSFNPDLAEAHNNLGVILASQQRFPEAIEEFRRALQLDSDLAPARQNLAAAEAKIHKP